VSDVLVTTAAKPQKEVLMVPIGDVVMLVAAVYAAVRFFVGSGPG